MYTIVVSYGEIGKDTLEVQIENKVYFHVSSEEETICWSNLEGILAIIVTDLSKWETIGLGV